MREPSTLQRVLILLAEVFRPLEAVVNQDRAAALLEELGVAATPAQASGFASAVQPVAAAVSGLLEDAAALTEALEADDAAVILARGLSAI